LNRKAPKETMGERKLSEKDSGERRMIILTFCLNFQ